MWLLLFVLVVFLAWLGTALCKPKVKANDETLRRVAVVADQTMRGGV